MTLNRFLRQLKRLCENGYSANDIVVNEDFVPMNHYKSIEKFEGSFIQLTSESFGAYSLWDLYGTLKSIAKEHGDKVVLGDNGKRFTNFLSMPLPGVPTISDIQEPVLSFKEYCDKYKEHFEPMLDVCMLSTISKKEEALFLRNI